jgi:hypothetical protein
LGDFAAGLKQIKDGRSIQLACGPSRPARLAVVSGQFWLRPVSPSLGSGKTDERDLRLEI